MITGAMHWAERSWEQFSRVACAAHRQVATGGGGCPAENYNGICLNQ